MGAPDRVHDLLCVLRVALADRHDHAVVEHAGGRHVVVDDVRDQHPQERQEDPLGGLAQPVVLLRRLRRDDRVVDRVAPHRHALDVQHRERLDRRVETGVIAERPLGRPLPRLEVSLQHDLGLGRHLERHGAAVDHLDPLTPEEPGEQVLVDVARQRRAGRVADDGIAADRDGHRQSLSQPLGDRVVRGRVLVDLPVHTERVPRVLLQPVQAQVALAGLGVLGMGEPVVVEDAAVARPHLQPGQPVEVDLVAGEHDLLTRRGLHLPRRDRLELEHLAEAVADAGPADRQLGFDQRANPVADLVERLDAERHGHPLLGPEQVDRDGHLAAGRPLEEKRGATGPHGPRHDLADLQRRIDRHPDPAQLAGRLEGGEKALQIVERKSSRGHGHQCSARLRPKRPGGDHRHR